MEDPNFPGLAPDWYLEDLLRFGTMKDVGNVDETFHFNLIQFFHSLAHDLAERLLPAFDKTDTGIPFPRVNLRHGLPEV